MSLSPPVLISLTPLLTPTTHILLDIWGVLHDGEAPYPGVLSALDELKSRGTKCTIISNSSKRKKATISQLTTLGFDTTMFSEIVTSGEVGWNYLAMVNGREHDRKFLPALSLPLTGPRDSPLTVCTFGNGADDDEYVTTSGCVEGSLPDLLLARGTESVWLSPALIHRRQDPAAWKSAVMARLVSARARDVPMLVTNPDRARPDAELSVMPGAIGDWYEEIGGTVVRVGKPEGEVFRIAMGDRGEGEARGEVVMVGDALETDILGGNRVDGVTSCWCWGNGIHSAAIRADGWESIVEGKGGIVPGVMVERFCFE